MTIQEFVKKNKKGNADLKKMLEIRTYIPIAEKRAILETILDECFMVDEGVLTCDYITMNMMFELAMIKYHTNLEIQLSSEDDYDELQEFREVIKAEYYADYLECQDLFDGMKQELYSQYSIESSIARLSNKISGSIEGLVGTISNKVGSLDMGSFGFDNENIGKFKELLTKYGSKV